MVSYTYIVLNCSQMRKTFVSSIIDLDNTACETHPTDELKLVAHDAVNGSQPNTQHGEDNDFGSWQLHDTIANSKSLKGSEINVVSSGDGFDCHAFMKKDSKGKEILNVQTDASCSTFEVTPHDNSTDTTDNQDTDISSINTNVICGNASSMLDADHGKQAVDMTSSNCDQNSNTGYGAQAAQSDSCGKDNTSAKSVERGTQIQFKGLHLEESTSSLRGNKVVFTLECSRCKQRVDQQLSASGPVFKQCTRCASAFGVAFRPAIIHQFSSILGYLDLDGCVPFDVVLPESELLLGCFHCSKETTVKGLQYGGNWSWCSHCHQKLSFQVQSTRFQQLQSGVATAVALRKSTVSGISSKPKKPQSSGVKEGQPLPANGTCKHYKKSYRWLRFPCCGKCYPCDLCHEEEEDHEMKYATRMVCGFCSREQPYSQQPCSGCKAAVTKSRSAYWEGGKGCRDKVAMSRNDDQKYRQHGKTTSRKVQKRSEGKGKGHKGK